MTDPTPDLAELRRLLDVNRGRYFHALPWHAWDRGIGYELHVGATCRDKMEPRGYCEGVNNGFRETFGAPEAELIVAAVNALPALLDAAAERDALAAKVEQVRALHKSSGDAETQGYTGLEYGYISPYCMGEVASDEYGVPWPCETIRDLDEEPQP